MCPFCTNRLRSWIQRAHRTLFTFMLDQVAFLRRVPCQVRDGRAPVTLRKRAGQSGEVALSGPALGVIDGRFMVEPFRARAGPVPVRPPDSRVDLVRLPIFRQPFTIAIIIDQLKCSSCIFVPVFVRARTVINLVCVLGRARVAADLPARSQRGKKKTPMAGSAGAKTAGRAVGRDGVEVVRPMAETARADERVNRYSIIGWIVFSKGRAEPTAVRVASPAGGRGDGVNAPGEFKVGGRPSSASAHVSTCVRTR
jgi:hypothetical protein